MRNATGTGELTSPTGSQPKAHVSYAAIWPDPVGRQIAAADYGTNGGNSFSRSDTVPTGSNTVLVSGDHFRRCRTRKKDHRSQGTGRSSHL